MSIENALRNRVRLLESVGQVGANIKHPSEFELYVVALELLNQNGDTERYFIFPVMPKSLSENSVDIVNIKKTMTGVHVLKTSNFIPTDITLSGTFGRKFRMLLGGDYIDFIQSIKIPFSKKENQRPEFDTRVKTGYGNCKILESIVSEARSIDPETGGVKTLIFHNLALGNSYIVQPQSLKFEQSEESNMIWNYTLQMKSLAPLSSFQTKKDNERQRTRLSMSGYAQTRVDGLVGSLTRGLVRGEEKLLTRLRGR